MQHNNGVNRIFNSNENIMYNKNFSSISVKEPQINCFYESNNESKEGFIQKYKANSIKKYDGGSGNSENNWNRENRENSRNDWNNKKTEKKPRRLRNMGYYIINALKFYELKNEKLTPILFVVILFITFSGSIVPDNVEGTIYTNLIYTFIGMIVIYAASTVYLFAHIKELRGELCTVKSCVSFVLKRLLKILMAYIAFIAIVSTGLFLLLIPGLVFYHMFMFNTCYLLDKNATIIEAFNESKSLTTGKKMEIFFIFLVLNLILFIPLFIAVFSALSAGNDLILSFVLSFATTVLTIMQQRLTAMIYTDMEYGFE